MSASARTRAWAVEPLDNRLVWAVPALAMIVGVVGVVVTARDEPAALAWLLPVLALVGALLWCALMRRSVTLADGVLHVRAVVNSYTAPLTALDTQAARIVDLDEHTELRPILKTFGTSMPGLQLGNFRLRDRSAAFVLLTSRRKVVVVPRHDGKRLLLSLRQPQQFLHALTQARTGR